MANCDNFAILEITDGTTSVDLLNEENGFLLSEWMPQIADFKDGGIFQNSPLAAGRRLVAYRYDNVVETMQMKAHHASVDALIEESQTLRRLLQKAADYWATDWQNTPVYVKGRARGETNTRYCLIHTGRLGNDANPYAQPFIQAIRPGAAVMDEIPLIFERGHWLENAPGSTSSVTISSTQSWAAPGDWASLTTTPSGSVTALLETSSGDLYAGTDDTAKIYKSTDGGVTWSLNDTLGAAAADVVNDLYETQLQNDKYLFAAVSGNAAARGVWRSTDSGANWTLATLATLEDVYTFMESVYSQWLWAYGAETSAGSGARAVTLDNGDSWRELISSGTFKVAQEISPATGAALINIDDILYSTLGHTQTTLNIEINHGSSEFLSIIKMTNGIFVTGMADGTVYYSKDADASTWTASSDTITGGCFALSEGADGVLYAAGGGSIWISFNSGVDWFEHSALPTSNSESILTKADGTIYAGDDGEILELPADNSATTSHVINSHSLANLTNVKVYDGSSFTDKFPGSSLPYDLLPDPPGISGDIIYLGVNENYGSLTFASVVFTLTRAADSLYTGQWQYYNGSWTNLDVRDNNDDGFGPFSKLGQWSVDWEIPSDWTTVAIDSVTARWVRILPGANTINQDPPIQGESDIYAMRNAYVEVADSAIAGDLPALLNMDVRVASDADGPSGSAPDGYINRALIGLRSVSRGSRFNAYLNASDQGNDPALAVAAGTDTTFADDIRAPTNRRMEYSPTSTGSWVSVVTFTLGSGLVDSYYGTFHVFLRCRQSGGSAGDVDFRLRTSTGSGGLEIDTRSKTLTTTNDHQFIDFGRLTIPVSSLLNSDETGDEATIIVQCNASSMTPDIHFYDLVLLPIDEWAGDFTDKENSSTSPLTSGYYLDVDSATFPKRSIRAQVRGNDNDRIKSVYQPVVNGEAILQANAQQRLWFMFARTASAGSSDWRSEPWMAAKITLAANQRYLGMRGAR